MSEFEKTPSFKRTDLGQVVTEYVVVLMGDDGDQIRPWGSAFFVAPGFAMTAKHVLEDFWDKIERKERPRPDTPAVCSFRVYAFQFQGSDGASAVWEVKRAWCSKHTDIAFLALAPLTDEARTYQWRGRLQLSMFPPNIGERIVGFGYPESKTIAVSRTPFLTIDWGLNPTTTVGEVTEIYEERRDRSMLSFPCFQVNARFDGGMSGGPIFNSEGQICGVICATMKIFAEDISYAATLWPGMTTTIDYKGPGFEVSGGYGAFELFKIGFLKEVGWREASGRIKVETDNSGIEYLRLA